MTFRAAVVQALEEALGEDAQAVGDIASQLAPPPKAEMGDLAFPCFPLAKVRRMAPPRIAEQLAEAIEPGGAIARVAPTGPYLNFFADSGALLGELARGLLDGSFFDAMRCDDAQRVMIEFSQPNTHKIFHVGHLRNVVLGDCLVRVLRARGHDVVAANYYGDFGIDVAKCLWWLRKHPQEEPPAIGRVYWLGRAYTAATLRLKEADEAGEGKALHAEVREVLRRMEEGDPEITELYETTRQWCLDEFKVGYHLLDVHFDHDFFESQLEERGQAVVNDYLERGVFVESQGAIICDLEDEGLGAALVRKSDGASLYMTWDLALAREKFDKFDIQKSIYVVGADQVHHFKQLFATLARMGYKRAEDCRHVSYELVMLPEGKMSSRRGTLVPMYKLRAEIVEAIESKMKAEERKERADWTEAQWEETAAVVSQACLKYGMLKVGNNRRVIFDMEAWINPEGDTGAYLLYSLARIAGIYRKGGGEAVLERAKEIEAVPAFGSKEERDLLNHLFLLPSVVARVENTCDPSALAQFVYEGAKRFSRFYQACPVLKAEEPLRTARLLLVKGTEAVLKKGLELLGIRTVETM